MGRSWLFADPENVAVLSTQKIVSGLSPILYVSHDEDDGMWQFLDGEDVREEDALILGVKEMMDLDSSLIQLADLPIGWVAWRQTKLNEWIREKR